MRNFPLKHTTSVWSSSYHSSTEQAEKPQHVSNTTDCKNAEDSLVVVMMMMMMMMMTKLKGKSRGLWGGMGRGRLYCLTEVALV